MDTSHWSDINSARSRYEMRLWHRRDTITTRLLHQQQLLQSEYHCYQISSNRFLVTWFLLVMKSACRQTPRISCSQSFQLTSRHQLVMAEEIAWQLHIRYSTYSRRAMKITIRKGDIHVRKIFTPVFFVRSKFPAIIIICTHRCHSHSPFNRILNIDVNK